MKTRAMSFNGAVTWMTRHTLVSRLSTDVRDSLNVDWNNRQKQRSTNDGTCDRSYRNLPIAINTSVPKHTDTKNKTAVNTVANVGLS